jgi:UPF0176 protein
MTSMTLWLDHRPHRILMIRCCFGAVLCAVSSSLCATAFQLCHPPVLRQTANTNILFTPHFHQQYLLYSRRNNPLDDATSQSTTTPIGGTDAVLSQHYLPTDATHLQMLSFYHFEPIPDIVQARDDLFEAIRYIPGLRGTIYIANEGINAQLAVPEGGPLQALLEACSTKLPVNPFLYQKPNMGDVVGIDTPTFNRLIVRTRDYVLRDGMEDNVNLDWTDGGTELAPDEWHQTLQTSSPILLDCRNSYESRQGTFQGAIPLDTQNFQESWDALRETTKEFSPEQPIAIFCTGGIRCVKTGAFLKQTLGFKNVSRLKHGIIGYQRYLRDAELPDDESLWQGENFLFDKRRIGTKGQDDSDTNQVQEN